MPRVIAGPRPPFASFRAAAVLVLLLWTGGCTDYGDPLPSAPSPPTGPPAPTLFAPSSVSTSSVDLTWTRSADAGFASYRVYRDTVFTVTSSVGADTSAALFATVRAVADTTITVDGLEDKTQYYFAVAVFDGEGRFAVSNVVQARTGTTVPTQQRVTLVADRDNTLYEDATGSLSNGMGEHVFAGHTGFSDVIRRALLHFDVAAVPAGSVIDSVRLVLHLSRAAPGSGTQPLDLHRVLASWGEGASGAGGFEGAGGAAAPGDATWIHRSFPGTSWTSAGGDFAPTASASASVGSGLGDFTWGSTAGLVAEVQGWVDGTAPNDGWLLKHADEIGTMTARRFDSAQNPTAAFRPRLEIVYTPSAR